MGSPRKTLADKIVNAVITKLKGRSGFGDVWDECDSGIKLEIAEELREGVQEVLEKERRDHDVH